MPGLTLRIIYQNQFTLKEQVWLDLKGGFYLYLYKTNFIETFALLSLLAEWQRTFQQSESLHSLHLLLILKITSCSIKHWFDFHLPPRLLLLSIILHYFLVKVLHWRELIVSKELVTNRACLRHKYMADLRQSGSKIRSMVTVMVTWARLLAFAIRNLPP